MNVSRIQEALSAKDVSVAPDCRQVLADIIQGTRDADVLDYLLHCVPGEGYEASGVHMLDARDILEYNLGAGAPGCYIFPYSYITVAVSIGGNCIVLNSKTGGAFWADHDSFVTDTIKFMNRDSGKWEYLEGYSEENVAKAMVPLNETQDMENFILELIADELEAELDELD